MVVTRNKLNQWIIDKLNELGWSQRELSRRSGVSPTTISDVINGQKPATFDFCKAVAQPLRADPVDVFRLAGLLPPAPAAVQVINNVRTGYAGGSEAVAAVSAKIKSFVDQMDAHQLYAWLMFGDFLLNSPAASPAAEPERLPADDDLLVKIEDTVKQLNSDERLHLLKIVLGSE